MAVSVRMLIRLLWFDKTVVLSDYLPLANNASTTLCWRAVGNESEHVGR
jgi:hypothetical protein